MPQFNLDKMSSLMSLKIFKGRSRPQPGDIFLQDGKTRCRGVVCREGAIAKDIIAEVCSIPDILIAPVARPFFALCDPVSLHPISPYKRMNQEDAKKQYQLRLFVNTGENSMHFKKMSESTYSYYHKQLKEDFIQDRLFPRATINTAVWMAAIDMAREACEKKKTFADLTKSSKEMLRYMPKFLVDKYRKEPKMQVKLRNTFDRFVKLSESVGVDHYFGKYVEVYEKDKMCGRHIYRLRPSGAGSFGQRQRVHYLLVVSSKDGIYKAKGDDPTDDKKLLCQIDEVRSLKVDTTTLTVTLETNRDEDDSLHFVDKKELVSFSVVVHTYHQLFCDANSIILSGDLTPPEECLKVGKNDGFKRDICHGPITPNEVGRLLRRIDHMQDGNYLIRESRNALNAYTLSLCSRQQIMNYRIIRHPETGEYAFEGPSDGENPDERSSFKTMLELIGHYEQTPNGLPSKLGTNISPKIVPVPLMASSCSSVSDTSSSTGSMILHNRSSSKISDLSSTDQSAPSTVPSSPTSTISSHHPLDPLKTPVLSHEIFPSSPHSSASDTSSNYPSFFSNVPDTSNNQPDTSRSLLSPDPHASILSPSSLSQTPSNSDNTRFLEQLAPPRVPLPRLESASPSTTGVGAAKQPNPLIQALIEANVNYIGFNELDIIGDLGSGNYSQVHLANWNKSDSDPVKVAVKIPTAKSENVEAVKQELKREIETMATLDHPNIVRLLGISEVHHFIKYIGDLPVVIMEYVEGGSLRGLLDTVKRNPALANTVTFLSYGKQIAEGMKYLEDKKLVHRDLAARNVLLVKETQQVKISDFGLARKSSSETKDYAYYIGQTTSNGLPIFWYAPECLRDLRFTTKGDVWSFGVTLWEMFSHGQVPTQILSPIIKGPSVTTARAAFNRLADYYENPKNRLPYEKFSYPQSVYDLMLKCWELKPENRPTFSKLSNEIGVLLELARKKNIHKIQPS